MIPREKPEHITWATEWVAMHMDFHFPEVTDAAFLAAFKKVMIEVAAHRLYDYRAAEQVEEYLIAGGHPCENMAKKASDEGHTRYSKIKEFIEDQMDILHGAADKWRGFDPMELEMWPAWMLTRTIKTENSDWHERWLRAGGTIFPPLIEGQDTDYSETGLIALKTDPIWSRLGDPRFFPGALGIDHPPFYSGSGLSWSPVDEIEVIALGLIPSDCSPEATCSMIARHIESKIRSAALIDKHVREAQESYLARNSVEAMSARYKEQREWWEIDKEVSDPLERRRLKKLELDKLD